MESRKKQNIILFVLGGLAAIGPFSIDMYLPGFSAIARDLKTDGSLVGYTLTSYTLGLALGQLLVGPVLDRHGRKKTILISLLVFILAAAGCSLAPSIYLLILFRFFLALGSSVGMVGANAIVRDLFTGNDIARALSFMMMVFSVAPIIAPTIGGVVVTAAGWRAIFAVLIGIGFCLAVSVQAFVPETRGRDDSVSLHPGKVIREYIGVLHNRQFIIFTIVGSLTSGMVFSYITGVPVVLLETFQFNAKEFGWTFGGNAIIVTLSNPVNRLFLRRFHPRQIMFITLIVQSAAALFLLCGFWNGFFGRAATISIVAFFLFCTGFLLPNATALLLQPFSKNAGSAAALSGCMSMLLGTIASALVSYMYNGTGIPMMVLFVVLSILALLIVGAYPFLAAHAKTSP